MFATKDHGEEFSGKIELVVESGKAKMSRMSRLSFPRVSVSKRKGIREAEERGNEDGARRERGRSSLKEEESACDWTKDREISRKATRVAFALEIRRADVGADQFGERPDTRYPDARPLSQQ